MLTGYEIDGEWRVSFLGNDMVCIEEIENSSDIHITLTALQDIVSAMNALPAGPATRGGKTQAKPTQTKKRNHVSREFSNDFKLRAIEMARRTSALAAAQKLGLRPDYIQRWKRGDVSKTQGGQHDVTVRIRTAR